MRIIDEVYPKAKAEVRLGKDNKTIWIKSDSIPLDDFGRVIIEDGTVFCKVYYDSSTD